MALNHLEVKTLFINERERGFCLHVSVIRIAPRWMAYEHQIWHPGWC